jgi:hypothetical protein
MTNKIIRHRLPKLNFIVNYKKEFWFIENKYRDARRSIGMKLFGKIISFNIPETPINDYSRMIKHTYRHIKSRRRYILSDLLKQKKVYQKKWLRFEKNFFGQMEEITG